MQGNDMNRRGVVYDVGLCGGGFSRCVILQQQPTRGSTVSPNTERHKPRPYD